MYIKLLAVIFSSNIALCLCSCCDTGNMIQHYDSSLSWNTDTTSELNLSIDISPIRGVNKTLSSGVAKATAKPQCETNVDETIDTNVGANRVHNHAMTRRMIQKYVEHIDPIACRDLIALIKYYEPKVKSNLTEADATQLLFKYDLMDVQNSKRRIFAIYKKAAIIVFTRAMLNGQLSAAVTTEMKQQMRSLNSCQRNVQITDALKLFSEQYMLAAESKIAAWRLRFADNNIPNQLLLVLHKYLGAQDAKNVIFEAERLIHQHRRLSEKELYIFIYSSIMDKISTYYANRYINKMNQKNTISEISLYFEQFCQMKKQILPNPNNDVHRVWRLIVMENTYRLRSFNWVDQNLLEHIILYCEQIPIFCDFVEIELKKSKKDIDSIFRLVSCVESTISYVKKNLLQVLRDDIGKMYNNLCDQLSITVSNDGLLKFYKDMLKAIVNNKIDWLDGGKAMCIAINDIQSFARLSQYLHNSQEMRSMLRKVRGVEWPNDVCIPHI